MRLAAARKGLPPTLQITTLRWSGGRRPSYWPPCASRSVVEREILAQSAGIVLGRAAAVTGRDGLPLAFLALRLWVKLAGGPGEVSSWPYIILATQHCGRVSR